MFRQLLGAMSIAAAAALPAKADEPSIAERMFHHHAIEAAVWAMPLLNYKGYRDALVEAGVGPNDVGFFSKLQDWRFQTATPNNTTPYIMFYWKLEDGPVVVEIPPAAEGIGIFGTIMDAWQRPLEDVGARGRDRGRGAKYLMVPEGYDGPLLPGALVYTQRTNNGFGILRPIIADASPENLALAAEYVKGVNIYPLSEAGEEPKTAYVDLIDRLLEMTPVLDGGVYAELHEILQEEPVEDQNLAMMGMLARIGIRRNHPFEPDADAQAIFDVAAPEALEYMIDRYHRAYNPFLFEGRRWSVLVPPGAIETDWSYEYPSYFDYDPRGAAYYAIISSVKNYGSATFYLDAAEDSDGEWLDGSRSYKLNVPAGVPVRDFWSITTYDLETASFVRDMPRNTIDSTMESVVRNEDGSIDIYFGPTAPEGHEANWLQTDPERRFFLLARFYGPEPKLVRGEFPLNDVEKFE